MGTITGVTQSGTEEVEGVQRVVKYSSISYFMLKPPYLLTQGFNKNNKAQEKLIKNMCNLGHGQSGGMGEEPSVPILMLISPIMNTV